MERQAVNVATIESQHPENWWYEAYCLDTRHVWDILIMHLGQRAPRPGMCTWHCCFPGSPTGSVQHRDTTRPGNKPLPTCGNTTDGVTLTNTYTQGPSLRQKMGVAATERHAL
jgi:hypothetical protein